MLCQFSESGTINGLNITVIEREVISIENGKVFISANVEIWMKLKFAELTLTKTATQWSNIIWK